MFFDYFYLFSDARISIGKAWHSWRCLQSLLAKIILIDIAFRIKNRNFAL